MTAAPHPAACIRLWRPTGLAGVEALHEDNQMGLDVFYFDQYVFAVSPTDHAEARYRRRHFAVEDGAVQLFEPGELYVTAKQHRPCSVRVLFVEPAVVERAARELGLGGAPHLSTWITQDSAIRAALFGLHASLTDGAGLLDRQDHFAEALRLVLKRHAERRPPVPPPDPSAVARARTYLHARWAEDVSLDDLAAAAGASKYHLVRQFRDEVGLPPHAYLTQLRLARAKGLLARGVPIARAAAETGFAAQSHLHRHFLRAYGVTPGRYARDAKT